MLRSARPPAAPDRARPRTRSRRGPAVLVVALVVSLGAATAPVAAAGTGPGAGPVRGAQAAHEAQAAQRALERDRTALYDLLDDTREQHGLAPLRRDGAVQGVAQRWAAGMASAASLRHNGALRRELPAGSAASGENVGRGLRGQPVPLHQAWLDSPDHRANALSGAYDTVGIGVVHDRRGALWAVVDFGAYG